MTGSAGEVGVPKRRVEANPAPRLAASGERCRETFDSAVDLCGTSQRLKSDQGACTPINRRCRGMVRSAIACRKDRLPPVHRACGFRFRSQASDLRMTQDRRSTGAHWQSIRPQIAVHRPVLTVIVSSRLPGATIARCWASPRSFTGWPLPATCPSSSRRKCVSDRESEPHRRSRRP